MSAAPRLPEKLSIADVTALDLTGRRFTAREGITHVRGVVRGVSIENGMLRIDVGAVERHRGDAPWEQGADFDYGGHPDDTSIFREVDGSISIAITFIGTITIRPELAP